MTYSTHALDAITNGTEVYSNEASAPVRHSRRRRHAHVMSRYSSGSRVSGFGV